VIIYEFLRRRQNVTFVKELCVASAAASEKFRSTRPYLMSDHGLLENGLNWADGHIECEDLHTVFTEIVASFAHFYIYGVSKCTFLAGLTGRTINNLEYLECPPHASLNHHHWCTLPCNKFPGFCCATKTEHSLCDWLMYYLQKTDFVRCPADMTHHSVEFVAGL